jgi:hypothetical protein
MSVCKFQPPIAKYTVKENKKSRKYENNLEPPSYSPLVEKLTNSFETLSS